MVLKSCPFCGFVPDRNEPDCIYPAARGEYDPLAQQIVFPVWNLVCYETGGGCGAHILGDSVDECITKWNTRVEDKNDSG